MSWRALAALVVSAGSAAAFELELPVACAPGKDCYVQQYVDRDAGPGVSDYACGAQTYDGHDGTDIRLRDTKEIEKGVAVLAAAPGIVVGLRDGMPDRLMRTEEDRAAVGKQECGNGVRIDHGDGWFTQYCHMRQGSVAVKEGDKVEAGTKLGEVGYSGAATFPHMHLSVTKDDKAVDPFLADAKAACGADGPSLWTAKAKAALPYQPGVLLALGLADHPVTLPELEEGAVQPAPQRNTPMVAYMWAINLKKGDVIDIVLKRGDTIVAGNTETLDRDKAQFMLFGGKKAPPDGWPTGTYTGEVKVTRGGKPVINETTDPLTLD